MVVQLPLISWECDFDASVNTKINFVGNPNFVDDASFLDNANVCLDMATLYFRIT